MKKRAIPAGYLLKDASRLLFGVVAILTVLILLFLTLIVVKGLPSSRFGSGDNLAPTTATSKLPPLPVGILKPKEGEVLSGVIPVVLSNPGGRHFLKLEFWVDSQVEKRFDAAKAEVSDKLYEVNYRLDSRKFSDGAHVLSLRTVDMRGKYETFAVRVKFANQQSAKAP